MEGGARIRWVGHATVDVAMDGVRLVTDPVLRNRVAHLRRRQPIRVGDPGPVDAVLLSHAHRDHLDLPSLTRFGQDVRILAPRGVGGLLRRRGFTDVTELAVGDRVQVGAVEVEATPADHDGTRGPLSERSEVVSYAIRGSRRLLFFGDTDLFAAMDGMAADLDALMLPIWGWGPTLGGHLHLDPVAAAEAVRRLRPRVAIPIHWGTFHPVHHGIRRPPDFVTKPGDAFASAVAATAPDVAVQLLPPGGTTAV